MDLALARRLLIAAGLIGAIVAGWQIAHDNFVLVVLVGGILSLWLAGHLTGLPVDALVAGAVVFGYLVGNRGFAQLHVPGVPMLPGEFALSVGLTLGVWRAVRNQTLQIHRHALNLAVLCWIALGAARMPTDVRRDGFLAVRDFALVYYALFFFLAQAWSALPAARQWLKRCLIAGLALAAPAFAAFLLFPEWLTTRLVIAGTPLIFVKNDVVGGFMAGGALWFVHRYTCTRRMVWFLLAAGALAGVGISNNRASVVALLGGIAVVLGLRRWKMLRVIAVLGSFGLVGLFGQALLSKSPFTASPIYRLYESMASIGDLRGTRVYRATNLDDKPDNNQFRLVWWRAVVVETWADGRWFGLGFGHDLAEEFLRIYYADNNDEFSVRSPHNFLLSVFSRMGLVGFAAFSVIIALMARQTWGARATADDPDSPLPLWLTSWTILAGACFGVVLEGPMGAIVFWTVLGLAHATPVSEDAGVDSQTGPEKTPELAGATVAALPSASRSA